MTIATRSVPGSTAKLKRELKSAETRRRAMALTLMAPLTIFLLLVFVVPIGALLIRAVQDPEVTDALSKTVVALKDWDRKSPPVNTAYAVFAMDLTTVSEGEAMGALARRLDTEIPGFRSLVTRTVRAMPSTDDQGRALTLAPGQVRAKLLKIGERWGDVTYWRAIAKNSSHTSPFCLLAMLDHRQGAFGHIEATDPDEQTYMTVFLHTFVISAMVALFALLLGYPLSYRITSLPERHASLVMVMMLILFWTSIFVRVAAWIVLLQTESLTNHGLIDLGVIKEPLALPSSRVGVYISMTHILLPFTILPLYSMMKSIPATYQRAAVSLGSHPFATFWRVYVPQTYPGTGAGALLALILALDYYITPALLGGPNDQMVGCYVACFTNVTINWGMACALGALLLLATLVLYTVYRRSTRPKVRVG